MLLKMSVLVLCMSCLCLWLGKLSTLVSADYVLQVEMVSFSHPSNTRLDGQCCDPDNGEPCTGGERCDTFFIFCLIPRYSNTTECPTNDPGLTAVSNYTDDVKADKNVILSNPFNLTGISTAWEGAQLYIQVLDLDSLMPLRFDVIIRYRFNLSVSVGLTTTRSSVLSGIIDTSITVSATVLCAPFYFGSSCQFFNHCESNAVTCSDRGTCVNGFNGFTCNCNPPYIGANCEGQNFCVGTNCTGRGTCTNGVDSYTCVCNVGYTGAECETDIDIDECLLMETVCSGHGNCSHGIATFTCSCDPGYTGTICETNIDDCVNKNCSGNELGGGPGGLTLIGGVVGGLLVLMLILLLLLVVVVVCVRRRAQGKTIQDTQLQVDTISGDNPGILENRTNTITSETAEFDNPIYCSQESLNDVVNPEKTYPYELAPAISDNNL